MLELEYILRDHARRYPLMAPTDAVKLIYQNEFGGGHLIRDEAAALSCLRREYQSVPKAPDIPRFEEIGNGLVRVNLAALAAEEVEPLGRAFIRSAAALQGDLPRFLEKLALLRQLTADGFFSFSPAELDDYLSQYRQAGYPMVSHSEAYRQAYRPAYRIVALSALAFPN